ncbi:MULTISPECIES: hypothetical protein [Winogradskyella]|uniref:hypothetical protein n=1 Tax=Winogradskyella TaxID=286104 RepID=UPI0015CA7F99|nr:MULTISPECIES: hypothetical protein [Winogradskyella]QXP78681.1 hypothetical protein H0I32_15980 [Winogradskyella sp. HaHa_3_26]
MKIKKENLLYYASVILYLISLTQNAFLLNNEDGHYGYLALIFGFYAVFDTGISWLANFLIIFSWLFRHKRTSLYYSLSALILGISFLFIDEIVMGTNNKYGKITGYGIGYYLWISSFLIMTIRNIFNYKKRFTNTVYN